ncbi:MAG: WbqC family protein [Chitinophagaceae bacterium]
MYLTDLQYFPVINYIITLIKGEKHIFLTRSRFQKSTLRNKMILPGSNGLVRLSIPIKGGRGVKVPYGEVEIDNTQEWQKDHIRTITSIYGNAPYFQFYEMGLKELYDVKAIKLFEWNLMCLSYFLDHSKMSNLIHYDVSEENFEMGIIPSVNQGLFDIPYYGQVFMDKIGFQSQVSCLDLLMNLGPDTNKYIKEAANKLH